MEKKHVLLLITPKGKEIKLGFMSPSRNGFVLGAPKIEGTDTSHLTVISKDGELSSHITPQEHPQDREFFPSVNLEEFAKTTQELFNQNLVTPISTEQMSEEVVYITTKFLDWLYTVKNILYEKRTFKKEIIHVINLQKLLAKLPQLVEEFQTSPSMFVGLCKAKEILEDTSKVIGMTKTRMFVLPIENRLYLADFSFIFNFNPVLGQQEISSPLSEIYRGMGISQYMREIEEKKIVEKLFSES